MANLKDANDHILSKTMQECLQYDLEDHTSNANEMSLNKYVLDNTCVRDSRLELPALWNKSVLHRLPENYGLAHSVLNSTYKKLKYQPDKLEQYDEAIKQQLELDIIEEVDRDSICNDPNVSYVAHNAVFRDSSTSTKCRVVFLSNLCDKRNPANLSHNQVSLPGYQLNNKLQTTATLYRFNKYLLIYDLEKAFTQLCLKPEDQMKLHFLWFRDLSSGDRTIITYRFKRVPFGMRFSPYLLMMSLYIILVLCVAICDPCELKVRRMLYNLAYMDNLAFSSSNKKEVLQAYDSSRNVFSSYKINLQQYATNCDDLSIHFDSAIDSTNLFGIKWNRQSDSYSVKNPLLNADANTKRLILASLNSIFDPLGILLPTLNRAKLFLASLHKMNHLKWDSKIDVSLQREWRNIAKQFNSAVEVTIPRYVGDYSSTYTLLAFTDANKHFYGTVIYLQDCATNKISFLLSKNRLISHDSSHSIPVLELLALAFGVEVAHNVSVELTTAFCPVNIVGIKVYTDSTIALNWLSSKTTKFHKIERKGVLINNALEKIVKLTEKCPMSFNHVDGTANPADFVTRSTSTKVLLKSNFYTGFVKEENTIKFPLSNDGKEQFSMSVHSVLSNSVEEDCVIPFAKYASFKKLCRILHFARKYIYNLKKRVKLRKPEWFPSLSSEDYSYISSVNEIIRTSQQISYSNIMQSFTDPTRQPDPLISQLNLSLDNGLLRVKGKCAKQQSRNGYKFPILLHKNSKLTRLLILDYHATLGHAGIYKVLNLIRERFWIPCGYITVKKILNKCVICRKVHGRPIAINQNNYKEYRINPSRFPFRDVAIDFIGFNIRNDVNVKQKIDVLIITCLFTRAINLIPCARSDSECFLEAFQTHIFRYGIPQFILSDNGSQIVGSVKLIQKFMEDVNVKNFLTERNIKPLEFAPYPSGASYLGGVVESLVKQVKNLMYVSMGKRLLTYSKFCLFVNECIMLVNKRPIAFKNSLSNNMTDQSVSPITPELLLHGYEIPSISIIPHLYSEDQHESFGPERTRSDQILYEAFDDLKKVKHNLSEAYGEEFLNNLRYQSINSPKRYVEKTHRRLHLGDVVCVKTKFSKPYDFPCGIITDIEENDLGEIVHASLRKSNGEIIRRHVTDLIFLQHNIDPPHAEITSNAALPGRNVARREAAQRCDDRLAQLRESGDI